MPLVGTYNQQKLILYQKIFKEQIMDFIIILHKSMNLNCYQIWIIQKKIQIKENTFLVALSSIVWREAWKYGERSWRYTQLDCGHALKALEISALILGWKIEVLNTKDSELQNLLGFDQVNRYVPEERELPDMLIKVSFVNDNSKKDIDISKNKSKI